MSLALILLFSIVVVGLCVMVAKYSTDVSMNKRRNKCRGECGRYGWTNLSEDDEVVNARCNRCGWINQYSKKHHS